MKRKDRELKRIRLEILEVMAKLEESLQADGYDVGSRTRSRDPAHSRQ